MSRAPQHPEAYARTILHHAITHGDLIGHDDDGQAVVLLRLPQAAFERLIDWDPDGDPDLEAVSEDEGGACEDEGAWEGDGCWTEDDPRAWRGLTPPSSYPSRDRTAEPRQKEEQIELTASDGYTYRATLHPDNSITWGDRVGYWETVA